MENKKNFAIGVLSGICATLFLFIIMGMSSSTKENCALIPINDDGSINVKMIESTTVDINVKYVNGHPTKSYGKGHLGVFIDGANINF
tara:strand:+ start:464 stop:727 length:264 start_codon:yes stop_codon:yes gene_type:complete